MTAQLTIANLYPLCTCAEGDEGNARALRRRAEMRGITAGILSAYAGHLPRADIYLIGGGWHPEQPRLVELLGGPGGLASAVADGAVVLGVNAGFQVLGEWFDTPDGTRHAGLGLIGARSMHAPLIEGRVVTLPNAVLGLPAMTGYERHPAHTELDADVEPLTRLESGIGNGVLAHIAAHHGGGLAAMARGGTHDPHTNAGNGLGPMSNAPDASALRRARAANANRRAHTGAARTSRTNRGAGHPGGRANVPALGPGAARIVPTTNPTSPSGPSGTAVDGAIKGRVVGTYLHGPVLMQNPDFADLLIAWTLDRTLEPLAVPAAQPARAVVGEEPAHSMTTSP
jgi:hypothetical protein